MNAQLPQFQDRVALVYLSCSMWSARKLDRRASSRVTQDAGARDDAGRFNKYLLAGADDKLREIQRIGRAARLAVEQATLPWDDAGNRLISNEKLFDLLSQVYEIEDEFKAAVADFVAAYPVLRAQAVDALGELAAEEDYPQPDVVGSKFRLALSVQPVAQGFGDVRTGLTEEQQQALAQHYETANRTRIEQALTEAWRRVKERVERLHERMGDDESGKPKVYRDSLVENLRGAVDALKSLDFASTPEQRRLAYEIEQQLTRVDAPALRNNATAREEIREAADDILKKLGAWI